MALTFSISTLGVLGAGTMGRNITRLFSEKGIKVQLYDPDKSVIETLAMEPWFNKHTSLMDSPKSAVAGADLVIETIPEILALKRELLFHIAPYLAPHAIVASNTSSFPLHALAQGLPFSSRLMLMHFFNPADLIPLVEIVKPKEMKDQAIQCLLSVLESCGKKPVILQKDMKGLIANRLQAALLREACNLFEQGIAGVSDIDTAVKDGIGLRWALSGPFEITDFGGLDVWGKVLDNVLPDLDPSVRIPDAISRRIANTELGLKSKKGFYHYEAAGKNQSNAAVSQREKLVRLLKSR